MAVQQYTVKYSTDGITFTALTNVEGITLNMGRQAQLDQIKTTTGSVEIRYPTGYATPIAGLVSGSYIRIQNTTPLQTVTNIFDGVINNVSVRYGIPYVNNVGQADFLTISFEGIFAQYGRMQGENYAMPANTLSVQAALAGAETGLPTGFASNGSDPLMAATTVNGTWADWIAKSCQTTNSRIIDSATGLVIVSPFYKTVSSVNFSDTANNATNQVYNQINFGSLADNFYTQVTVAPESFGSATVVKVGATVPYRTLETNTFNASTAQAADFASYLLANYDVSRFAILSISCNAEAQSSFALDSINNDDTLSLSVGTQVSVAFRGTTFQCIIEGVTMSATPKSSQYTFYLSGADLNAYLILDNAVFGKLDDNKLGY